MSLPDKFKKRKEEDAETERILGIRKHDPLLDEIVQTYTPADIERLEWERVRRWWHLARKSGPRN